MKCSHLMKSRVHTLSLSLGQHKVSIYHAHLTYAIRGEMQIQPVWWRPIFTEVWRWRDSRLRSWVKICEWSTATDPQSIIIIILAFNAWVCCMEWHLSKLGRTFAFETLQHHHHTSLNACKASNEYPTGRHLSPPPIVWVSPSWTSQSRLTLPQTIFTPLVLHLVLASEWWYNLLILAYCCGALSCDEPSILRASHVFHMPIHTSPVCCVDLFCIHRHTHTHTQQHGFWVLDLEIEWIRRPRIAVVQIFELLEGGYIHTYIHTCLHTYRDFQINEFHNRHRQADHTYARFNLND